MVRSTANFWPALGVVLALLASTARSVSAAPVRVMARTAIHAEVDTRGSLLVVEGEVRDSVGRKLAGLPIRIEIAGAPLEGTPIQLTSNDDGSFRVRRMLPDGNWQIGIHYTGNTYLAPAELSTEVLAARVPLDLRCTAPRVVAATAPEFEVSCETRLGDAPWPEAAPALFSSCSQGGREPESSNNGRFLFLVAATEFIGCTSSVRVEGTEFYDASEVVLDVDPVVAPRIEASIAPMPMQRLLGPRFTVEGALFDGDAPYAGADVEIRVDDQALRTVQADENGRFRTELTLDVAGSQQYDVQAVWYAQHPANLELARSSAVAVTTKRGVRELIPWLGALGLLIVAIGILAGLRGLSGLRLQPMRRRGRAPAPVAPVEPIPTLEAHTAGILVLDAQTGRRVPDCVVTVTDAASGEVVHAAAGPHSRVAPPAGLVVVHATAGGFVEGRIGPLRLSGGETSVVRLRPIRIYVRELVHSLLDEFEIREAESRWGRGTVLSIRRALRTAMRALRRDRPPSRIARTELQALLDTARATPPDAVAAAEALVLLLDEAWWSPTPDAGLVTVADELVALVRAAARARSAR